MGSTRWSDEEYVARDSSRRATGAPVFAYSADVAAGRAAKKAHATLDPKSIKNGKRECRDSTAHPNSHAVAVFLDVTGSMATVPALMQKTLCSLMGLLLQKSLLTDPAIMVAGIGDATCDTVPFQVGQFESGIEIENDLTNLFLEGGGGGTCQESYELALFLLGHCTAIDCFEKRRRKGYAFIIGDEMAYDRLRPETLRSVFGDVITVPQGELSLAELVRKASETFEIFYIQPNLTHHYEEQRVLDFWRQHLGQRVLLLEKPENVSELIAATIGLSEGQVGHQDLADVLVSGGMSNSGAAAVSRSLSRYEPASGALSLGPGADLATL